MREGCCPGSQRGKAGPEAITCVLLTFGRRGRVPHRNSGSASSPWGSARTDGPLQRLRCRLHSTGILEKALGAELGQKLPLGLSRLRQAPERNVSVSTPGTWECDLIWEADLGRYNTLEDLQRRSSWFRVCAGSPGSAVVKNLPASAGGIGDRRLTPGLGRPGEGNANLLQCSCLEKSTDRRAW